MAFTSYLSETLDCQLAAFCKVDKGLLEECLIGSPAYTNCLLMANNVETGQGELAFFIPQGNIFEKHILAELLKGKYNFDLIFFNASIKGIPFFSMPGLNTVRINNIEQLRIFNFLLNFESAHAYPFRDYVVSSTLGKIAVYILRCLKDADNSYFTMLKDHFENPRLLKILGYIHEHIRDDIALEKLADLVELSSDYVSQFFKRCMGMSLQSYLIDQKVKIGLNLLISTSDPISAISDETSFVDQAYFNRRFKMVFGVNPLRLRKKYQLLFISQAGALMTSAK